MAFEVGTAANSYDLVVKLNTFLTQTLPVNQRWTALRSILTGGPLSNNGEHEIIWKAPGLSGVQEIFTGVTTYKSVTSDYYNLSVAGFTGYVPGNTFSAQPGFSGLSSACAWNQPIPYWLVANGQRAILFWKIQNTYDSIHLGHFLPYGTPLQYPYPLLIGGSLAGAPATRYSDTSRIAWWKGNHTGLKMRFVSGSWLNPKVHQYHNIAANIYLRNTGPSMASADGYYAIRRLALNDDNNIYGEVDGLMHIPGFNNAVENTLSISGTPYVVLRDMVRTGFHDYCALRLS